MISIIIASANSDLLGDVGTSINETIGVEYEIISFDNANGEMGICEVYNRGIKKARYDTLCFMHEDVKMHTKNWGRTVIELFDQHSKLGLLGVAGCTYKAKVPSSWFSFLDELNRVNIIQHFKFSGNEKQKVLLNPEAEKLSRVTGVDGVWFCTSKRVTDEISFDEELLKGFHGYDVDFSLSVSRKWDVCVTYDILLEHFSEGRYDGSWLKSILKVHKKWKGSLPRATQQLSKNSRAETEKRACLFLIEAMQREGYSKWAIIATLFGNRTYASYGWLRALRS